MRTHHCHASLTWSPGRLLLALALLAATGSLLTPAACAQLPQARLFATHPSGGQRGTTVDVTLTGGTDLEETTHLYFSHPGIHAVPKMQTADGKSQPIAGQFVVTISSDVPVGVYDIRARGKFGLSNPRTFSVGDRREVLETEPNNAPEQAMVVELNTVVNGRSDSGADLDWYRFTAKAGQRTLISLRSRRIDSRMDGVLELYQAGRRVAHQHIQGRHEPVIDFTPAADGEYLLKVHDFVYGGSAEFFYRLSIFTGPHVDFVIPASGLANASGEFAVFGRNLPGGQPAGVNGADGRPLDVLRMQIAAIADPASFLPGEQVSPDESGNDGVPFSLSSPAGSSNPVTVYFASAPTAVEQEPNNTPEKAQTVAVPLEITGQFQVRGDLDLYQFEAKSGQVFWIEVFGQRNGTLADPVLAIDQVKKDDKGVETLARITALDDNATNIGGGQFNTVTDDPVFRFAAPGDGIFRITIRDRAFENRGDPSLVYRLSIRKENPDFRLVVLPAFPTTDPNQLQNTWDLALRKGDNAHLTVMAFRRDGFTGAIDIQAEGLPTGVTCSGACIPANQNVCNLVVSSSENAAEWFGAIRILGRGRIEDPTAVAAETNGVAARTAAVNALPALDKALNEANAALKTATDQANAAREALEKDLNNEGLKKTKADADAALAKADMTAKAAQAAKAAGDAKIAEAAAAVATARTNRSLTSREIVREARSGTIVWSGNPGAQMPAQSRMARSITLSVTHETAPYQLLTGATHYTVNQGSQILVPLKLLKRAGFDNNVNVTFVTPPQNVQVENKPINKGTADQLHRVYVQNNAAVGTYTLFVQSQSQVSYSRNPEAAAAAAKEKELTDKVAAEAAENAKKAAEAKAAAEKKVADTAAAAKQAADAKPVAEKLAVDTAAAAKLAAEEKAKTEKLAIDTEAAAKAAAEAAVKAKTALDADANNEELKKAKADADTAAAKAAEEAKKAAEAKPIADKKAADADEAAKKAAEAKAVADKAAVDTEAAAKAAAEEKAAADKKAAEADQKSKDAAAAKAAADKKATDTANVAKPQNVNAFFPAPSIVVTVKPAPGTLALNVPNSGALKRGAGLEVKVTINRANGFGGPVELSLPIPPGVTGVSAAPVTIPAGSNEGTLMIQASPEATMGQLANLVVRASMDFDGQAAVDQPIAINVQQ